MAFPRVFVSSTCYDLTEVRDSLVGFIESFGFEPCLSERGDIFYHPDLHTHESCINEVSNCQLFILIVGGRFGGSYIADPKKSIVNAEYYAAKELNAPVFTFVKKSVLDDYKIYKKNIDKDILESIEFPSFEEQVHAIHLFEFIDEIISANVNNGFFGFDYSKEIQKLLRKQWAGMFFDFLQKRRQNQEIKIANTLLSKLSTTSNKLEELVKNLYLDFNKTEAESIINLIETKSMANAFFNEIFRRLGYLSFDRDKTDKLLMMNLDIPWYEFLEKTGEFECTYDAEDGEGNKFDLLINKQNNAALPFNGPLDKDDLKINKICEKGYNAFKSLNPDQRNKVLIEHSI